MMSAKKIMHSATASPANAAIATADAGLAVACASEQKAPVSATTSSSTFRATCCQLSGSEEDPKQWQGSRDPRRREMTSPAVSVAPSTADTASPSAAVTETVVSATTMASAAATANDVPFFCTYGNGSRASQDRNDCHAARP